MGGVQEIKQGASMALLLNRVSNFGRPIDRQMHDVLASLVSGKPVHQRQEELEKTPGVAAPNRTDANGAVLGNVPVVLEGIAGNGNATVGQPSAWDDDDSDDDW
jgi:hypothetical protein